MWEKTGLLWPGCHNLKVKRFSQGLPCKTPLLTHSKQAMVLPSTQSPPNPWKVLIPKMPRLTQCKQDTDLALLWCEERYIFCPVFTLVKNHKILVWIRSYGHNFRGVGMPKRLRQKELKQEQKGMKKVPPPTPNHWPHHILFWTKGGAPSVIGFSNYFLRGEFRHVRTQQQCWSLTLNFNRVFLLISIS
jgi:hypothetical protein